MAQIILNIPDAVLQRVIDGIAFDYQPILNGGTPNPITKAQHAKRQIIQFIKNRVRQVEQQVAIGNLTQSIENDITIT